MTGQRHGEMIGELERLATPVVLGTGVELVELELKGSGSRRIVRLFVDRPGMAGINLDDCQKVSHAFGAVLDDSDLFAVGYMLEVSSPGLDRPIVTDDDYRRNTGRRLLVRTTEPIDGETAVRGVLVARDESFLKLRTATEEERTIPLEAVLDARQDLDS